LQNSVDVLNNRGGLSEREIKLLKNVNEELKKTKETIVNLKIE